MNDGQKDVDSGMQIINEVGELFKGIIQFSNVNRLPLLLKSKLASIDEIVESTTSLSKMAEDLKSLILLKDLYVILRY